MKIGIVSDTHFGYRRWEQDAASQAERAMLDAASKCDIILMPGDIFDTRVPRLETISQAMKIYQKTLLSKKWEAKCINKPDKPSLPPIMAIHGTHELRGRDLVNPVQLLETAGVLTLVHNDTVIWELNGTRVAINGLGGVPDELAKAAIESLDFTPSPNAFNIFVFHQSLKEYILTDKDIMSLEDLPKGYDLYISGHMHKYTKGMDGKFLIPGSTVVTQLRGEETGQKGYIIYDTDARTHEFVPIKTREFCLSRLEFDKASPTDVHKKAKEEIEKLIAGTKEKPIIRIVLSGTLREGFTPRDVEMPHVDSEKAYFEIDNELDLESLKEKIATIRQARAGKMSVMDFGMSILRKEAQSGGFDSMGVDEIFDILCEEAGPAYERFAQMKRPEKESGAQKAEGAIFKGEAGKPAQSMESEKEDKSGQTKL